QRKGFGIGERIDAYVFLPQIDLEDMQVVPPRFCEPDYVVQRDTLCYRMGGRFLVNDIDSGGIGCICDCSCEGYDSENYGKDSSQSPDSSFVPDHFDLRYSCQPFRPERFMAPKILFLISLLSSERSVRRSFIY